MRLHRSLFLLFAAGMILAQNTPSPIGTDPAFDTAHPASSTELSIPSHGQTLFGIFYQAAGAGDHPTVVLLHGFPGYEQNLDLAQAIRRAGWNVLALHYRGSWGVGGQFTLEHAMEDADTMVAFVRSPEAAGKFHIDRSRVVVIGHSMGGFMAASAAAHEPAVLGAVMIGTWDITASARAMATVPREQVVARLESHSETEPADFLPLNGATPHTLALEIAEHRGEWDLASFAPRLASRPVLLLTADDGSDPGSARFEQALKAAGNTRVERVHTATDHGFNGKRVYLETLVLNWLAASPMGTSK